MLAPGDASGTMLAIVGSSRLSHLLLRSPRASPHARFRCVLGHSLPAAPPPPRSLAVASSALGSVVGVAAASAANAGAAHAAVTSTLAQVAVTAVAIASGACLSTKVDFLWPRVDDPPDSIVIEGVDVTGYPIFQDVEVQKAIAFAAQAHLGQLRKSGEPYVTHCIHTGKILAALVPSTGRRAVNTVVAGILHDVIDDTVIILESIEQEFGDDVAQLVAGVSKLSNINQLLRRNRTKSITESPDEANNLRVMLLGMVDDPRVVLIKLADRLHNMRTIYALPVPKARAVAQETLAVWCSLASRLGVWALKVELEDLCFAVLQPKIFKKIRSELGSMWDPSNKVKTLRRSPLKTEMVAPHVDTGTTSSQDWKLVQSTDEREEMKDLLLAVLPFDLFLDRRRRTYFLNKLRSSSDSHISKPKIVSDAEIALMSLAACEEALEHELLISTSYIPGMEVTLSSRLKSLYGVYCKMKRKNVEIKDVYDARALRVIIGDKNGLLHGLAVKNCYSILGIVHRLWTPIDGQLDDYIVNPKPSGYQSLHTAVQGPDNLPLEVQIRTQRMHEYAEYGLAAHWLYKESNVLPIIMSKMNQRPYLSNYVEDEAQDELDLKYRSLKAGHPVLRIEGSQLLAAVVLRVDKGGLELLVAVSFGLEASGAVAERRSPFQLKRWEAYARLYKKVSEQWWFAPGHGDWSTNLEKYTLCQDGMFHKQDQFGRLLPTFIQLIDLKEEEEAEYWMVVSDVFEGKEALAATSASADSAKPLGSPSHSASLSDPINSKVQLLRTMLQWEEQVRHGTQIGRKYPATGTLSKTSLTEVAIISWPSGKIMRMQTGSTAADAARRMGLDGKLVLVNGHLVLPQTELKDGDIVEVRL